MIVEPLQALLETVFPGVTAPSDITSDEIDAAEARLGAKLPQALKDFYTVVGGFPQLMDGVYRILAPEQLRIDQDHLIFCDDPDGTEQFGFVLHQLADFVTYPKSHVDVRTGTDARWFGECSATSAFLLSMAAWSALSCLKETARRKFPDKQLHTLTAYFEPLGTPDVRLGGHRFGLIDRTNHVLGMYFFNTDMLCIGSPVPGAVAAFQARSGLSLKPFRAGRWRRR